jgi:hypothetical protein
MEPDLLQQQLGELNKQLEALESKIEAAEDQHLEAVASGKPEAVIAALKARRDRLVEEKKVVLPVVLQQRGELQAKVPGNAVHYASKVAGDTFASFQPC